MTNLTKKKRKKIQRWLPSIETLGAMRAWNRCFCTMPVRMGKPSSASGLELSARECREGGLSAPQARGGAATGLRWQRSHTTHFLSLLTLWGSLSCHYSSACPRHYEASAPSMCVGLLPLPPFRGRLSVISFVSPITGDFEETIKKSIFLDISRLSSENQENGWCETKADNIWCSFTRDFLANTFYISDLIL